MEKPKPSHDLAGFKEAARSFGSLEVTASAIRGAREAGLERDEMLEVLQSMERSHFFKAMTSYSDHRIWQDVYHVPWFGLMLYVKFTEGRVAEFRLLSFKEK